MATYCVSFRDADPLEFSDGIGDFDDAYDDDGSDVEDAMDALAGSPPGSADWKQYIASFERPESRQLRPAYERERADPKHRMGDLLEECFKVYAQKHPEDAQGVRFYQWLDGMGDWDRTMLISGHGLVRGGNPAKDHTVKPSMVKAFMKGVAYLDKAQRKNHRVYFSGGTATFRNGPTEVPLSTADMSTVFSGKGFGIWVISEGGKLYVGNHVKGMVHHSSFLAGANVMCGGEMWARNGKILFITAKSGHYNPGTEHLSWALRVLETCVDNYDDIKVMAWRRNTSRLLLVAPYKIIWDTSGYYAAWGDITQDEMSRLRAGNFASFPES